MTGKRNGRNKLERVAHMKQTEHDALLFELTASEKMGNACRGHPVRPSPCGRKVKFLDQSAEHGGYYCSEHVPIRINDPRLERVAQQKQTGA